MTGSPDGSHPQIRTTLGQWFENPLETRPLSAAPKSPNRKEPRYSANVDGGLDLITLIQRETDTLTHLSQVFPQDLPYYDTHPRLASYISRRSMWIHDGDIPIALLAVQPESTTVMLQILGGSTTVSPTIYFRERKEATAPSVAIGLSPSFNLYASENTTIYPLSRDNVESSTAIADKLLLPLKAQREDDFLLPHAPTAPSRSFMNVAIDVLQAATAEHKIAKMQPVFHANSEKGTDTFALALYQSGRDFEATIVEDPKTMTTTLAFTTATGSGSTAHTKNMRVALDSDGIRISDGLELKDERVPSVRETSPALQQIRRALVQLHNLWSIVDVSGNPYVTEKARDEIPAVISYLLGLINTDGTINDRLPYLAPFHGIKAAGHIVRTPLPVPRTVDVVDISGKTQTIPLVPDENDLAGLSTSRFFGHVTEMERRAPYAEQDTAEHVIPLGVWGALPAHALVDLAAIKESPFWESAAEAGLTPAAEPGSVSAHSLLEPEAEVAILSLTGEQGPTPQQMASPEEKPTPPKRRKRKPSPKTNNPDQ